MRFWLGLVACFGLAILHGCAPAYPSSVTYVPPITEEQSKPTFSIPEPIVESEPMTVPETPSTPPPVAKDPKVPVAIPVKLVRGDPRTKKIALTFDDGPHAGYTESLIRILQEFKVPATFFLIGRNVDAHPELARMAQEAGIELANHTYTHARLPSLSDADARLEIIRGADAIENATGFRPRFFRPPGGEYDQRIVDIVEELKMTMVLWTADAGDFTTAFGNPKSEAIIEKVMRYAGPGGIIIMHDPMPTSLKALPAILTSLMALGYEFVTVSELAAGPNAVTTGGPRIKPSHKATVQALIEQGRYPRVNTQEATYASPEQRIKNEATSKGRTDQGIDQGSQSGKDDEGQGSGDKGSESSRTQGTQKGSR